MQKFLKHISLIAIIGAMLGSNSCNAFLDVVPDDGLPSIETAFNLRSTAIRYLATCYSYMTNEGAPGADPAMFGGDEVWDLYGRLVTNTSARVPFSMSYIARGMMSPTSVYSNDWVSMYRGIRCCDILVENIERVPDMTEEEKTMWKAEVTFLKAYYHFNLVRKWGPIPVIEKSLPIDSDVETVRIPRSNIDDCYDFILKLLDEAMPNLPLTVASEDELGRITKPICASFKARVAVYAASPLFNGNKEEEALTDAKGNSLFPEKSEAEKIERWTAAMTACQDAIATCEEANFELYDGFDILFRMSDSLKTTLTLRQAFNSRWNKELIWGNTQTSSSSITIFQRLCLPIMNGYTDMLGGYRFIGVPLKVAEQFYTVHGLPIENDAEWSNINPYDLRTGDDQHAFYLRKGYVSVKLNYDREPRFYSSLGFDGGTWLGQLSNYNDVKPEDLRYITCRIGGAQAKSGSETGPVTGYFPKKYFPYNCTWTGNNSFTSYWFPFPMMRLSDLYLLYAEAINEAEGPDGPHSAEMFEYINAIRERAKVPDVKTSWDSYSTSPGFYKTQVGMRSIIHRERLNELAFESQRFWDLRRWKEVIPEYQKGIYGFTVTSASPEDYYVKKFIYEQKFGLKDYFWPIPTSYLESNPSLTQNLGW